VTDERVQLAVLGHAVSEGALPPPVTHDQSSHAASLERVGGR
jgi:hypothetical protein